MASEEWKTGIGFTSTPCASRFVFRLAPHSTPPSKAALTLTPLFSGPRIRFERTNGGGGGDSPLTGGSSSSRSNDRHYDNPTLTKQRRLTSSSRKSPRLIPTEASHGEKVRTLTAHGRNLRFGDRCRPCPPASSTHLSLESALSPTRPHGGGKPANRHTAAHGYKKTVSSCAPGSRSPAPPRTLRDERHPLGTLAHRAPPPRPGRRPGQEERLSPASPEHGRARTHQSSSRATFFSSIDARARAAALPMSFPTRLHGARTEASRRGQGPRRPARPPRADRTARTAAEPAAPRQTSLTDALPSPTEPRKQPRNPPAHPPAWHPGQPLSAGEGRSWRENVLDPAQHLRFTGRESRPWRGEGTAPKSPGKTQGS